MNKNNVAIAPIYTIRISSPKKIALNIRKIHIPIINISISKKQLYKILLAVIKPIIATRPKKFNQNIKSSMPIIRTLSIAVQTNIHSHLRGIQT